jgi:hypothetical protein
MGLQQRAGLILLQFLKKIWTGAVSGYACG